MTIHEPQIQADEALTSSVDTAPLHLDDQPEHQKESAIEVIFRRISTVFGVLETYGARLRGFNTGTRFWQQAALELIGIMLVLMFVAPMIRDTSPEVRLPGAEFSYLINSVGVAEVIYKETGSIPMWNPFMARGEPLIENPHSFVLNPLMTLPALFLDPVQGTKFSALFHLVMMGVGGWLLGYMLRLETIGRVSLALLLAGSGGMPWALGRGFYQISLSQAYVPWIYAAFIGIVNFKKRWAVGLFAVASMLMVFAGSFWYVLPVAISIGLLFIFAVVRLQDGRLTIDRTVVRWCFTAFILTVGLCAIRVIPQAAHTDYVYHPQESLTLLPRDFFTVARAYFDPVPFDDIEKGVHYISTWWFALVLFIICAILPVYKDPSKRRWRIIIPAFLLVLLFTGWAQDGTPFLNWLYTNFPILREWRFLRRMLAAATPWIAVLLAIGLEDSLRGLLDYKFRYRVAKIGLVIVLGVMALATIVDVNGNWGRLIRMGDLRSGNEVPVYYLRNQMPHELIQVDTRGFFDYFPFYETFVRGTFGNPDYRALPLEPTLGAFEAMNVPPRYGTSGSESARNYYIDNGFKRIEDPTLTGNELWEYEGALDYAFLVAERVIARRTTPLFRMETRLTLDYTHNIDSVSVRVHQHEVGDVLVVTETAYPGWEVEINGEAAKLESVGGLIGVRLPQPTGQGLDVLFFYHPRLFYMGSLITLVTMLILTGYLLRLDRFMPVKRSVQSD